jgi:hypothetical protein
VLHGGRVAVELGPVTAAAMVVCSGAVWIGAAGTLLSVNAWSGTPGPALAVGAGSGPVPDSQAAPAPDAQAGSVPDTQAGSVPDGPAGVEPDALVTALACANGALVGGGPGHGMFVLDPAADQGLRHVGEEPPGTLGAIVACPPAVWALSADRPAALVVSLF